MTKRRLWTAAVALCLAVCLCISLSSCKKDKDTDQQATGTTAAAEKVTYTIEVVTEGEMPLENVGIYIYTDDTLEELVWFAKTDASGKITFADAASDSYVAVLSNVPEGYHVEEKYLLTGESTQIVLSSGMLSEFDLSGVTFNLGDMIYDLSVNTPDGTEYRLSELLKEKKAVILNFWYLECQPCRMEFPYLQKAYEEYSDQIEVLALNPVNTDDAALAAFQKEQGLTFPMAVCDPLWQQAMQLTAFPTTVVIDRFGTISLIHKGSVTEEGVFESIFKYFSADDYEQGVITDVEDILSEEEEDEDSYGTAENPLELSGVSSFQVTVKAGGEYYVNVYKVSNLYMSVRSSNVYVKYNNKTYNPSGGSVGLNITSEDVRTPVKLVIGNSGTETETFMVYFSQPKGSLNNPYTMSLGEFTVSVAAGNAQGVYYRYNCTKDGVITVQCLSATAGVPYDFSLYNLDTYRIRSLQSDAVKNENGYYEVSISVNAGDTLQFSASSLPDSSGYYAAATFKFQASYSDEIVEDDQKDETITYAVTVTDEDRNPVPNAQIYLSVDGETTTVVTKSNGVASTKLLPGEYQAVLVPPIGYKAKTTDFVLTESIPTIAVKLDKADEADGAYEVLSMVGPAYYVYTGDNFMTLNYSAEVEVTNYFVFYPEVSGLYEVTTADDFVKISNRGTTAYQYTSGENAENNIYTLNVKDYNIGNVGYVIGIIGESSCNLKITRVGAPILDETDAEWSTDWQKEAAPAKQYSVRETGTLTYVDLTTSADTYALVKGTDGYYHLGSAAGSILYVNLGNNAPYVSLYDMLGFNGNGGGAQNLSRYFYDEDGNFLRRELYTDLIRTYVQMRDTTYDVYPLTDDLIYMLQNGGEHMGWWDSESAVYKFGELENFNEELGWLFACCYFA